MQATSFPLPPPDLVYLPPADPSSPPPPPGFDFGVREDRTPLPDKLKPLLGECWPAYEQLRALALRPMADPAPSR
jgi:hypothetical protein